MPKFSFVAKDKDGKTHKNIIDAINESAVVERLQKQNLFVISIKELKIASPSQKRAQAKRQAKKRFSHKKTKLNDLLVFARQMATMLEAGVSLLRSLNVIRSQVGSEEFSIALKRVRDNVEQGGSLSAALAEHPKIFNQFWVSLIEVGEASGTIPLVLNKLVFYLEQQTKFRSTIISGLVYPLILFMVSMGAVIFFALFVGPRFESIFETMEIDLPLITIILLATFKFIKSYFFVLLGVLAGSIFFLQKFLQTYSGKMLWEKFIFNLPQAGEVYRLIIVERFASQMSILIDSGVPILYALEITERLVNNNTCAIIVNDIKESVREGALLAHSMERTDFFPVMASQMITVGEETGELSKMLKHVAAYYQEVVETFMHRFATIIEPFMLVFMGAIIGTIVIAMFLPMFNISQLGGG